MCSILGLRYEICHYWQEWYTSRWGGRKVQIHWWNEVFFGKWVFVLLWCDGGRVVVTDSTSDEPGKEFFLSSKFWRQSSCHYKDSSFSLLVSLPPSHPPCALTLFPFPLLPFFLAYLSLLTGQEQYSDSGSFTETSHCCWTCHFCFLPVFFFNLCPHAHATVMRNGLALSGERTLTGLEAKTDNFHVPVPQRNRSQLGKAHTLLKLQCLLSAKKLDNLFAQNPTSHPSSLRLDLSSSREPSWHPTPAGSCVTWNSTILQ